MATIEKLISNCLLAGYGVNLTGVGALSIVREPAKIVSNDGIEPPKKKISFTAEENPEYDSVIDLIKSAENIDAAAAQDSYKEWLDQVRMEDGTLEIREVGVVKNGSFYVSEALYERLNPALLQQTSAQHPVTVKCENRRGVSWLTVVIAILCLLIAGALIYGMILFKGFTQKEAGKENTAATEQPAETPVADSLTNGGVNTAAMDSAVGDAVQEGMYYLVLGVFSIESNADKLIKSDPLYLGRTDTYQKHPFKGGKTMVSAYRSTNRAEVEQQRRNWEWLNSEIWVYGE